MASLLRSIIGNGRAEEALSAHGQQILARMERERASLEEATRKAEATAKRLEQLAEPVAQADKSVSAVKSRLGEVETHLKSLEGIVPRLTSVNEQVEALEQRQQRAGIQTGKAVSEVERVQSEVAELSHKADMALCLKDDLDEFLNLQGPFQELQAQATALTAKLGELREGVSQAKEQQDQIARSQELSGSRLEEADNRHRAVTNAVLEAEEKVKVLGTTMADLSQLAEGATDTKRQLVLLQALADSVGQKVAAVEQQREAVERAGRQANQLSDLVRHIDVQVRNQESSFEKMKELRAEVEELTTLHVRLMAESEEIRERQRAVTEFDEVARRRLNGLQAEVDASADRLALERDGFDAVAQRVIDLRQDLAALESRFGSLHQAAETLPELQGRIQEVTARLDSAAGEIDRLGEDAHEVRGLRAEIKRLGEVVDTVGKRLEQAEETGPAVQSMLRDFNTLQRSHEGLKDATDQVQFAADSMRRAREDQNETERWLAGVQQLLSEVQAQIRELNGVRPTVDLVQKEVERVTSALTTLESRESYLGDLNKRLVNLSSLAAQLDERSEGLVAWMDVANEQLGSLASRAADAADVEKTVTRLVSETESLEQRGQAYADSLDSLEGKAQDLQELSQRTRRLGAELDQRQAALEKASEHLERASQLRQEAGAAAQDLEDQSQQLVASLSAVEKRSGELNDLANRLDDRITGLRFSEKRLGQFEEKLAQWERTEEHVGQALGQLAEREATIRMVQGDIRNLLQMAERTVEDVRSINAAQHEVAQTRAKLDEALAQLRNVDDAAAALSDRQRQIERAEARLGRAEALLLQIRSSMETMQSQRAFLDHVLDKSGSLTFQIKQAEALIQTLREERDLANKVRSAVEEVQEEYLPEAKAG